MYELTIKSTKESYAGLTSQIRGWALEGSRSEPQFELDGYYVDQTPDHPASPDEVIIHFTSEDLNSLLGVLVTATVHDDLHWGGYSLEVKA